MPTTIINASAGSGKTYRLAVAYLQALLTPQADGTPISPQQVLATTFTRAAASEILERVLRRLAEAVVSDAKREKLLTEIGRPGLGRDHLATLLASVCDALPHLQVGTIDALFARIVRVMALDLAFPPAWTVADDAQADELALDAADRMLRGPDAQLSIGQWRRYKQFNTGMAVRSALVGLLENNRFLLLSAPVAGDAVDLAEPVRLDPQEGDRLIRALGQFEIPLTGGRHPAPHQGWKKAIAKIQSLLHGEPTLVSILRSDSKLLRKTGEASGVYARVPVPQSLRDILGSLIGNGRADLRRLHDARLAALAALALRYHEFRRLTAYAAAAYRFPEVEAAAAGPLPTHLNPDDLYFRLDGQVQHLLLDEFQDTSLGQFRFLWPIIGEIRASQRLFFAVGDVKQSIYGWRGADRHLLNRLSGWLVPDGGDLTREHLDENRRSSPAVLAAIDRIFLNLNRMRCLDPETYSKASTKERAEICRDAATSFIGNYRPHRAASDGENRNLPGRVRLLITPAAGAEDDLDEEEAPDEIGTILDAVERHHREDAYREIAVLCRRRKWIPSIIAGLRQIGIEASGEGGSPVADSAAVELVLSMLTWIDHPGHTLAREHVRLSGMGAVFDFDAATDDPFLPRRALTLIAKNGLAHVVAGWIRHESFRRRGTTHDQVRCEQLVEMARGWDAAGGGRLSGFVERVRSQRLDNPISSRVRVMTIHGSKGLEFDAVILADLETRMGGGEGPHFVVTVTDPVSPPQIALLPSRDDAEWLGEMALHERHQQEKFEEDLSVLYVALTRARSFLDVVVTASQEPKPSLAGILAEGWEHHETGAHVIEECAGLSAPRVATENVIGGDPAIWEPGRELGIPNFQPVPVRLGAVTPSGQEGAGLVKLAQVLNTGNRQALEKGTAVHALLSRIEWLDSLPSIDDWISTIPEREADPEACRNAALELYPRLLNIRDPLAAVFASATWLDRWRDAGVARMEVWRERRFAVVLDRSLMNGSFDRVVLGLDADGRRIRAEILDFKTDRVANDEEREARRKFHQPQLDAYATALRHLTALPADSIRTQLVWINPPSEKPRPAQQGWLFDIGEFKKK